jgi:hypothetical protein
MSEVLGMVLRVERQQREALLLSILRVFSSKFYGV